MASTNKRMGKATGVNCAIASSTPSNTVRIRIRTLTSQTSQTRSSKADCMSRLLSFSCSGPVFHQWNLAFRVARTSSFRRPHHRSLPSQLADQREQRHVQRDHDAANHDAEQTDNYRLQHGQHVFGGGINFVFVKVG